MGTFYWSALRFVIILLYHGSCGLHFIQSPQNITVCLNSTVVMRCDPDGSDIFTWTLNRTPLQPRHLPPHITGDENLNVLTIFAVKELNNSVFNCTAIKGQEFASASGHLLIKTCKCIARAQFYPYA